MADRNYENPDPTPRTGGVKTSPYREEVVYLKVRLSFLNNADRKLRESFLAEFRETGRLPSYAYSQDDLKNAKLEKEERK